MEAHLSSISEVHDFFGIKKPINPLVSVIELKNVKIKEEYHHVSFSLGMYFISCKTNVKGNFLYGRNSYDFQEGSMLFIKPDQIVNYQGHHVESGKDNASWALLLHPDYFINHDLSNSIEDYSFFYYYVNEALHLSNVELESLREFISKIASEIKQSDDGHSQNLILSNIKLILDYCSRYYDRQFDTRTFQNRAVMKKLKKLLKKYYSDNKQLLNGIPKVSYLASELNISSKYLSDLLKKETGENSKRIIDNFVINKAKIELLSSTKSISEIAYSLGFEYSQHFAKMFKSKTGLTPSEFRNSS